jgi:NAD(P)-dependent dehydrogenase (short-subunit alcohol dehydrogenase family)
MTDPILPPTPEELAAARRTLSALAVRLDAYPPDDPDIEALVRQFGRLTRAAARRRKRIDRQRDQELGERVCGLRADEPVEVPAAIPWEWSRPRSCYVCHRPFTEVHAFYDSLCPSCAELNYAKRLQSADLTGRVALLTGGRVKIGYQIGLKLLRAGAEVIVTTRFPADAARRYAAEADADEWGRRLHIVPLDLRHLGAVESLARGLAERFDHLDILVQNAAQTVRHPPAFYRHLLAGERAGLQGLPGPARPMLMENGEGAPLLPVPAGAAPLGTAWAAEWTQRPFLVEDITFAPEHFPVGQLDADGQQVDLRPENSWTKELPDISTVELLEVQAINCLAPFVLLRELTPLLKAGPPRDRFVVMVSAREGQLNTTEQSARHPHTNMAKAALNMLTRTSAGRYAEWRIYINSLDPGWVSEQHPQARVEERAAPVTLPLDAVDGAARVLDPVFGGVQSGKPVFGVLLKDYQIVQW